MVHAYLNEPGRNTLLERSLPSLHPFNWHFNEAEIHTIQTPKT